jgi:large subunit ribosomal protein L24
MSKEPRLSFKIRRDDIVIVIAGKERGKSGKVMKVFPGKMRAVVEKLNMIKKHSRPSSQNRQGGIVEKEAPIHISNLMLLCPKCKKQVRVSKKILEDGKKVRQCKKCGEIFDK